MAVDEEEFDEEDEEWVCKGCKQSVYIDWDLEMPDHALCWLCSTTALDKANVLIEKYDGMEHEFRVECAQQEFISMSWKAASEAQEEELRHMPRYKTGGDVSRRKDSAEKLQYARKLEKEQYE